MKRRSFNLLGLLLCVTVVCAGLVIAAVKGLVPCSLCYLERTLFIVLGVLFLLSQVTGNRIFNRICTAFILFFSAVGASFATWHVFLQEQGHTAQANCGASLQYLLKTLPLSEAISHFMASPQDCGIVDWKFLGLSMAGYALIAFAINFTIGFLALRAKD